MSFGGSPGDIITAGALALRAYRACRAAAGEFAEVTREVSAVSILVQDLEDQAASLSIEQSLQGRQKQTQLRSLIDGIIYPLRELEELATKYSSLSTAKKNNWERLQFATKSIDDIRTRLILHTSAAQNFLDGLTSRSIARIECESDKTNTALHRIEQVLADIVKDIKHGGRDPSVVSDGTWSIWTELKRELRMEEYPVEVVQQYKDQIKQYLRDLLHDADLEDGLSFDEIEDPGSIDNTSKPQSRSTSQMRRTIAIKYDQIRKSTQHFDVTQNIVDAPLKTGIRWMAILLLSLTVVCVQPFVVYNQYRSPFLNGGPTRTSMNRALAHTETATFQVETTDPVILELKAGLLRNEDAMVFMCGNMYQAWEWIDHLSPLFDAKLMDDSAIKISSFSPRRTDAAMRVLQADTVTCPAQTQNAVTPLRRQTQLDGSYWDIYSPEPP